LDWHFFTAIWRVSPPWNRGWVTICSRRHQIGRMTSAQGHYQSKWSDLLGVSGQEAGPRSQAKQIPVGWPTDGTRPATQQSDISIGNAWSFRWPSCESLLSPKPREEASLGPAGGRSLTRVPAPGSQRPRLWAAETWIARTPTRCAEHLVDPNRSRLAGSGMTGIRS
jgi:hypothetical protein